MRDSCCNLRKPCCDLCFARLILQLAQAILRLMFRATHVATCASHVATYVSRDSCCNLRKPCCDLCFARLMLQLAQAMLRLLFRATHVATFPGLGARVLSFAFVYAFFWAFITIEYCSLCFCGAEGFISQSLEKRNNWSQKWCAAKKSTWFVVVQLVRPRQAEVPQSNQLDKAN